MHVWWEWHLTKHPIAYMCARWDHTLASYIMEWAFSLIRNLIPVLRTLFSFLPLNLGKSYIARPSVNAFQCQTGKSRNINVIITQVDSIW